MRVSLHPHALERMTDRGVTETEVLQVIDGGEEIPAKHGRTGFRRNFAFDGSFRGKRYSTKQVEVIAVSEGDDWLVITAIARYF